ncbi:6-bladed beta-propeller [Candidatus Saganbacteria bacterium]|nr:6-bladed beta-propeller [Candidatus Saganbacteria bacterium]
MSIRNFTCHLRGTFNKALLFFLIISGVGTVWGEALVWPRLPEKARIEYLYNFSQPADLKMEKKLGGRIVDFIFGRSKTESDRLVRPQGIFARAGLILVTDTGQNCVHVFNENNKEYFKITRAGKEALISPVGAAADKNGAIFVSDSKLKKVFIFNARGDYSGELGPGRFERPTGIAIDNSSGRIYVVDTLKSLVNVFDAAGFLFSFGARGGKGAGSNHPTYLALDKVGDLYLVDSLNFRVQVFSSAGQLKNSFGRMGRAPGAFSQPKGIALDTAGNIYVSDSSFDNVQIFSREGKLLLFFGDSGKEAGGFWLPAGLAIDENDRIFVADSYNSRVQVFRRLK